MARLPLPARLDNLTRQVLGRGEKEYFLGDLQDNAHLLSEAVAGQNVLVIGGAGSIGSGTVRQLARLGPSCLHVVDRDENGLAELVRDLRSDSDSPGLADLRTLPLDFGSPLMQRFVLSGRGYDVVLNFAALKHVRSEKDTCSLIQLLETNLCALSRALTWLLDVRIPHRLFSVSTDKAANPVSLMGASKRAMEDIAFAVAARGVGVTSARFANVAFSSGSLLDSFRNRLAKRQPIAVPQDTYRFFLTLEEAGRLCLLASLVAPPGHVVVPCSDFRATPSRLDEIAVAFLRAHGLQPRFHRVEAEARASVATDITAGSYPILLTERDTSGEKAREEFAGSGERLVPIGFEELEGIPHLSGGAAREREALLAEVESIWRDASLPISKEDLIGRLKRIVPSFTHTETGRHLDERM
jgi:nucleoside-diphosphate-sugar epimerase